MQKTLKGQISNETDIIDLTNDVGTNLRSKIIEKKTIVFTNEKDAKNHAATSCSYHYPVFKHKRSNGMYAVPK